MRAQTILSAMPAAARVVLSSAAARVVQSAALARVWRFAGDEAGEGFIDVLVKMLIAVVVGAVLLAIMRQAIPQLFTDMLTKIRDIFEV
ncbi:MAG: DUF6133 family protein [Oscillospiraceae bacterium]|nr:DUF6133 family protein [Oscillospiraceae bacterium]